MEEKNEQRLKTMRGGVLRNKCLCTAKYFSYKVSSCTIASPNSLPWHTWEQIKTNFVLFPWRPRRENKLSHTLKASTCQNLLYFKHLGIKTALVFKTNLDRVVSFQRKHIWPKWLALTTEPQHLFHHHPWLSQWGCGSLSLLAAQQVPWCTAASLSQLLQDPHLA